jgi:hypothetical protein
MYMYMYVVIESILYPRPHMQGVTVYPDVTYGAIVMLLTTIPYL